MSASAHHQSHHEPTYDFAVDSLLQRFGADFTREEVRAAVDEARAELEPGSTVRDFLELLVERRARDALCARLTERAVASAAAPALRTADGTSAPTRS